MNSIVTLNSRITLAPRSPAKHRSDSRERAYRRALRAAEMAAWQAADPRAVTRLPSPYTRDDRGLDLLALVLLAATASALVIGAVESGDWVTRWEGFVALFQHILA